MKNYYIELYSPEQKKILQERDDYLNFIEVLRQFEKPNSMITALETGHRNSHQDLILGYALSSNKILLLLQTKNNIEPLIEKLCSAYVTYFNTKHKRRGSVFLDKRTIIPIAPEQALNRSLRYLHNFPVRLKLVANTDIYPWTSHHIYNNNGLDDREFDSSEINNGTLNNDTIKKLGAHWLYADKILNSLARGRSSRVRYYQHFLQLINTENDAPPELDTI